MSDEVVWGIHAGRAGEAESLFLGHSVVAIGWPELGDLSRYSTREEFKTAYAAAHPDSKPGQIATMAGQPFRFVHEMRKGDIVVYSSSATREVFVGRVIGDYRFQPELNVAYPSQRQVEWTTSKPRTHFSQGALYELGAAMSLFQLKNYGDEYAGVTTDDLPPVIVDAAPENAPDIEEQTRDFVLKRLSQSLKGLPLEEFIRHLLECMGYKARLTRVNEPSVDLIAHKDVLGLEPPIIRVQVKSGDGKTSDRDVSALFGKLALGEFGLFVALGSFTPAAMSFANSKPTLRLIDGSDLVDLIFEHYENFDSRFRALLPLKRVFVPDVAATEPN